MLRINDRISIPMDELHFDYARSGGPGGQNVNKVATKAVMRWTPADSPSLPEPVRRRLLRAVGPRLNSEGELIISSQRTRDRLRNIDDCLDKLRDLVLEAATPPKPRIPTRPTLGSKQRTTESKKQRSQTKKLRKPPSFD
ncbi:alternative ribosome rescue aminoacyl-tRNA hydrolase ArfB [Tautonia plasticadhaerens]|uniref:Peptidyl-tRNA hydrolase ArfB n=1 Tax=Tautonia plasticadhaerens TaxID=2527974 RepID=A0A518H064_9BACT|nr:alternative ribosome rescue aminoacyl-tRNA hydrolase ArfB [Tautonia plasticadhaerens]QDV34234.1 Peptidyl-tRNA hydrolase ArfB [Tautonia plasticadhaerens]